MPTPTPHEDAAKTAINAANSNLKSSNVETAQVVATLAVAEALLGVCDVLRRGVSRMG